MALSDYRRIFWSFVLILALVSATKAFNPVEWAKGVVESAPEIKLPEVQTADILRQISDALPTFDTKEVERAISEFSSKVKAAEHKLQEALANANFDLGTFGETFSSELEKRGVEFQQELLASTTLTEEEDKLNFADLDQALDKILDKVGEVFVDVAVKFKVDRDKSRTIFDDIRDTLKRIFLFIMKAIERHPCLFELLLFITINAIPLGGWLIGPLLLILGFSPLGPVRGSFAAGAQRKFYGAAGVPRGGWFAASQRAGMKGVGIPLFGSLFQLGGLAALLAKCVIG